MKDDFKVLLINPALRPESPKRNFPIGLSYIASAMKRAGFDFELFDIEAHRHTSRDLEELLSRRQFDAVALGTLVTGYKYVKEICNIVRENNPDAVIIAGNSVASSVPEALLSNTQVDVAVIGEGDLIIVDLLNALKEGKPLETVRSLYFKRNGEIFSTPREAVVKDINSIPIPDWDIFDMDVYLKAAIHDVPEPYPIPKDQIRAFVMNTARGCLFRCTFCYHVFNKDKYRYRSADSVLAEIALLQDKYGINYLNFFDELTFFSREQVKEFVEKTLTSGLKFYWNADIRGNLFNEKDVPLLEKVKQSGCISFGYSLESANAAILRSMNKKMDVEEFAAQKKVLDLVGIKTFTSLVLGYPEETLESIKETFDVCYDLNIYPSAGYLLPQPGTPMYDVAKEKGLIPNEEDYLLRLGDRQDLRFNLTGIPDDIFQDEVCKHLKRISDKLQLGLPEENLIKTGNFLLSKEEDR